MTDVQVSNFYKIHLITKCAPGYDELPAWIFKEYGDLLTPVIKQMCNLSIETSDYPSLWKFNKRIPLHKTGDKFDRNNFRPITLLNIAAKCLDYHIYRNLLHYMISNKKFTVFK